GSTDCNSNLDPASNSYGRSKNLLRPRAPQTRLSAARPRVATASLACFFAVVEMKVWPGPNVEAPTTRVDALHELRLDDIGFAGLDRAAAAFAAVNVSSAHLCSSS